MKAGSVPCSPLKFNKRVVRLAQYEQRAGLFHDVSGVLCEKLCLYTFRLQAFYGCCRHQQEAAADRHPLGDNIHQQASQPAQEAHSLSLLSTEP